MIEKLYTVEEVAELASVTGRTIRNYLKSGRLVGRKIGGQWRFPESEVQRLLTGASAEEEEAEAVPAPSLSYAPASDFYASSPEIAVPDEPDNTYGDAYSKHADAFDEKLAEYAEPSNSEPQASAYSYGNYAEPARLPTPELPSMPRQQASPPSSLVYAGAQSAAQAVQQREAVSYSTAPAMQNQPAASPAPIAEAYIPPAPTHSGPVYPTVQTERPTAQSTVPVQTATLVQHAPASRPAPLQQPLPPQAPVHAPLQSSSSFQQAPAPQAPVAYYTAEPAPAQPEYRYEAPIAQMQQALPPDARYEQQAPQPTYAPPAPQQAVQPTLQQQNYSVYAQPQPPAYAPKNYAAAPQASATAPATSQSLYAQPQQATYEPPAAPAPLQQQAPAYAPYPQAVQLPFYAGILPAPGYYAPQQPMQPAAPTAAVEPEPVAKTQRTPKNSDHQTPDEERPAGAPELSDVARRVTRFVSEVHDCTHGPVLCAVVDLHQALSAARVTSERLADIASQESETGMLCQSFVEFDERYYIARFSLFGTSNFLFRCLKLIG